MLSEQENPEGARYAREGCVASTSLKSAQDGSSPRLFVSIVAWKGADLTINCLRSLQSEVASLPGCHVYVVDNASPDGAADTVDEAIRANGWSDWATLIRAPNNGGFAYGNNIVVRLAMKARPRPDYVLLLNPDTLVREGAFRSILEFMASHPKVGIAGGRCEDPDTTPQVCSFRFPSPVGEFSSYLRLGLFDRLVRRWITDTDQPKEPGPVDWVAGAFMIVRTEVFDAVGLMDEGYFLYFEETDFILRARRANWPCWHVPHSRVVHLVGQTTGVTAKHERPRRLPGFWFESRRRYFVLNYGRAYAIAADLCALLACALWRLRVLIERKPNDDPPYLFSDLLRHSALFHGRRSLAPRQIELGGEVSAMPLASISHVREHSS